MYSTICRISEVHLQTRLWLNSSSTLVLFIKHYYISIGFSFLTGAWSTPINNFLNLKSEQNLSITFIYTKFEHKVDMTSYRYIHQFSMEKNRNICIFVHVQATTNLICYKYQITLHQLIIHGFNNTADY